MDPLTKPEWRAGVNQVLSPMWRVGEGDPSGLVAPIGAVYRQTDANATYGNLSGLLWNKVGTGTTLDTDWLVDFEGRWVSYTPTITSGSGSYTTVSADAAYTMCGKTAHLRLLITITAVGTGTGATVFTFPASANAASAAGVGFVGYGRADAISGKMLQAKRLSGSQAAIFNYDNSGPASSGEALQVQVTYEVA